MALYQASDFTWFSDSYAVPAGGSDVIFTGSVNLILSTGITQQVFDTLSAALKCIHFMEQQSFIPYRLMKDVTIINLRSKLLMLEMLILIKKWWSRMFLHIMETKFKQFMSMADMVSEALASVGFKCIGLPWSTDVNPKLETDRADKDRPRIQVVDYV